MFKQPSNLLALAAGAAALMLRNPRRPPVDHRAGAHRGASRACRCRRSRKHNGNSLSSYFGGHHVAKDIVEAGRLFLAAAEQGDVTAQINAGGPSHAR